VCRAARKQQQKQFNQQKKPDLAVDCLVSVHEILPEKSGRNNGLILKLAKYSIRALENQAGNQPNWECIGYCSLIKELRAKKCRKKFLTTCIF
jgi:hypothetical protein